MHPYSVAKMVTSLGFFIGGGLLNMVAGGFSNDLVSLDDTVPHDRRYDRVVEYTEIVTRLLTSESAVSFDGEFYRIKNVKLSPRLPAELVPTILMSGSSEASLAAAAKLGATAIKYRRPFRRRRSDFRNEDRQRRADRDHRSRDGRGSMANSARAFPDDRKGQIAHELAMKTWIPAQTVIRSGSFHGYKTLSVLARPISELQDLLPVSGRQL
jgi:alkanesulfonate monooxygenase